MSLQPQYSLDHIASACYRTFDRIENLKIKVRLSKIADKNVPLIDESLYLGEDSIGTDRKSLLPKPEVAVFGWQQKVFSPSEVLRYKNLPLNPTQLERQYYEDIQRSSGNPKSREGRIIAAGRTKGARKHLFTYVHADNYLPPSLHTPQITTSPQDAPSPLTDSVLGFQPIRDETDPETTVYKRLQPARQQPATKRGHWELGDVVTDEPIHKQTTMTDCGWTEMHLMAYVHVENVEPGAASQNYRNEGVEVRLCTIKAYDNGLVTFTPGLEARSGPKKAYRFVLGDDVYEYTLKNASSQLTEAEEEQEWKIFQEFYNQQRTRRSELVGKIFTPLPEALQYRLHIYGEIVSAYDFRNADLYIRYTFDLPGGWKVDEEQGRLQILSSCTQVARTTWQEDRGEASFGCPLEIVILGRGIEGTSPRPRLYITVGSVDAWDRHRVEGYGYVDVPRTAGCHHVDVSTWRPFGTFSTRMREFFIGGSPELEDLSYLGIPAEADGKRVNKYGFQTESSGTVRLRLNIVHQADVYQVKTQGAKQFEKGNILAISDALQRARARVAALQESRKIE